MVVRQKAILLLAPQDTWVSPYTSPTPPVTDTSRFPRDVTFFFPLWPKDGSMNPDVFSYCLELFYVSMRPGRPLPLSLFQGAPTLFL